MEYIGATCRTLEERVTEHERSQRLGTTKSALGRHLLKDHPHAITERKRKRGRRDKDSQEQIETDYRVFFENFDFSVIDRGRDVLDTFLRENMAIQRECPAMNDNQTNGFVF